MQQDKLHLNSLSVAEISKVRGATSTEVEITATPNSNDIVPVRDQILEIDIANSIINVSEDTLLEDHPRQE